MNGAWGPGAASANVQGFDTLFTALVILSVVIVLLVGGLVVVFGVRFRKGTKVERHAVPTLVSREVEIGWTAATAFIAIFIFWWAASFRITGAVIPDDALEIHVEAKQWMWKVEHPSGARELNALHVPRGQPVVLKMASQDVIHSFFVPAFRLKQDVVPGRISILYFEPTRTGRYPLECAEYCGTDHARMGGEVVVMEPELYASWTAAQPQADNLAREGAALFTAAGCSGCHSPASSVHAPQLDGVYGRVVNLIDGRSVVADEPYIRDSILRPARDVVAGYDPIMPTDFSRILDDGEITALVSYIRELGAGMPPGDETLRSPMMETDR
ncbi:Cytochrome c oxidase, subunit II [Oceaniovalibus guishaninsula JLT2003]|uniref:Cytochrome c oxidase subunit 2 n=1 Tax=Oceaniovalibus guishaninsula JLT2003 TaxID=1231392 RepID=K2HP21_9RHOB|nr:cytochrome c oxidase subunit II [Oceaniovalibus guishaninsula]EKE44604.1 Cytochrome c oxidase, subunit II [Oceaniovalibus guishaninsula JLT2003]